MKAIKAKRGDLVVFVIKHITTDKDFKRTLIERFYVGVVKSITRDGIIKTIEYPGWNDPEEKMLTRLVNQTGTKTYIVPKNHIDVEAALNEFRSHVYESSTNGMIKPYANNVEVKKALKPYLVYQQL